MLRPPRLRSALSWLLAVGLAAYYLGHAWDRARDDARPDGNRGHVIIDYGGQWVSGRMLVEGHGRYLYRRDYQRNVVVAHFRLSDQDPDADLTDAESLLSDLMNEDSPEAAEAVGTCLTPLAAADPLQEAVLLRAGEPHWTPEKLEKFTAPRTGGSLYPPTHALLFAPVALLRPQQGYRVLQWLNLAGAFVCGACFSGLGRGRLSWPLATCLVLLFPGFFASTRLGQNGTLTLAVLAVGWWLLARDRPVAAGAVLALLAAKPVWAVAYFPVLLLTRRWRAAFAMAAFSAAFVLVTLPVVGVQSWLDWYQLGQQASGMYDVYTGWIYMSRDLYNLPARWLSDLPPDAPRRRAASLGLWLGVSGLTFAAAAVCWRRHTPLTGPAAAFVLLGAWLSGYHFMFYDVLPAALPAALLLADPGPPRRRWLWLAVPCALVAVAVVANNLAMGPPWPWPPLPGWYAQRFGQRARWVPAETPGLLALWAWSGIRWLWPVRPALPDPK